MQSPTIVNPAVLVPVNPAIEKYMRSLASRTDHPVLAEMESVAEKNNFPIVGRLVGIFLETMAKTECETHIRVWQRLWLFRLLVCKSGGLKTAR